jgi:hypothetical protein
MKVKLLFIILSLFILSACKNDADEEMGVFILEYPNENVSIEGVVGEKVVLPPLRMNDYVFIGWTDGEDYYGGLTEVVETSITLTPSFVPVEDVFDKVEINLGQVHLMGYHGTSDIVGLPEYWHDYLVVGLSSHKHDIKKLFIPNSVKLYNIFHELTDYIVYGDEIGVKRVEGLGGTFFEDYISNCRYADGRDFDINQPEPGLFNEGCQIKALLSRNDEAAVVIPSKGVFYTYDVVMEDDFSDINNFSNISYETIEYMSFSQLPNTFMTYLPYLNRFQSLELLDLGQNDDYIIEDNRIYSEEEGERYLNFIYSQESDIEIDANEVNIEPGMFHLAGPIEQIEIKHHDLFQSINGILYAKSPTTIDTEGNEIHDDTIELMIYPINHPDTSFVFPANLARVNRPIFNDHLETITINDHINDIHRLTYLFPKVTNIHVPDGHPYFIEEDGVIYDKAMEQIIFVNEDVKDLILPDSIQGVQTGIHALDSVTIGPNHQENMINIIRQIESIDTLILDDQNPYMTYQDEVIYSQETNKILYIKNDLESLVLDEKTSNFGNINYQRLSLTDIHLNQHINEEDVIKLRSIGSLEGVTVDENNPYIQEVDGLIYSKDLSRLLLIPKAIEKSTITIPASVSNIALSSFLLLPNVGELIVAEDNPIYASLNGVIYDKALTEILFVQYKEEQANYQMPDTLESYSMLGNLVGDTESIYIGKDYPFFIEPLYGKYYTDPLTQYMYQFDTIEIHEDSPFYHDEYKIITNLDQTILLAFTGNESTYEIPSYIESLSPFYFMNRDNIEHLVVSSDLLVLSDSVFSMENLASLTIKGFNVLHVEGLEETDILNQIGDNYHYDFASSDLIVYVEQAMLSQYQTHPFWSLYDIRPIE